jgi:hypothetical protein
MFFGSISTSSIRNTFWEDAFVVSAGSWPDS